MNNVVSMHTGEPIHQKGDPVPELVDLLKDLLKDAKRGKITGLCAGWEYADGTFSTQWAGYTGAHDLMALSSRLAWRIQSAADGEC